MVNSIGELVRLIAHRDGISLNEAWEVVEDTQEELREMIARGCHLDDIEETLAYNLGLELDYFEILI